MKDEGGKKNGDRVVRIEVTVFRFYISLFRLALFDQRIGRKYFSASKLHFHEHTQNVGQCF